MNNKIRKLQEGDYFQWNNLSREDKVKRNKQIAKQYLDKGPSIQNYYNALKAYFGGFNPENPYLITGEAPSPGWGKQGITGLHKLMAKLPETKQILLAPLAGRSRAAATLKMEDIVKAQQRRDEIYKRWASLYKQEYDPTPTTFRTKPARIRRQETNLANSNARTLTEGKTGGSYSPKSHTIRVTPSKTSAENLEDIAFHEGIHSYGLGESPSYAWKSKYLNFPEGTNPYFLDPREIATHGIQQGQNLGIKVGQAYPGREAMIKIIENRPEGQGFGGVPMILYNNAKTNSDYRRLWSLLNGTFKDGGVITTANARKWKHKEGGIIKAQLGESLDVDKRRDTTGNYITSQLPRWGAVDQPNIAGLWDVLNYNITSNPHIITGEPIILPGRFGGFRSGRLANKRWLENSNPITSEGSAQAAKDWLTEIGYKYNPEGKAIKIESTAMEQVAKKRGRPVGSKNKPVPVKEEKPVQVLKTDYTQSGTATERYIEGKRYGIPRKGRVSSNDKNARALEGEDARIKNAGYTNVKKGQIQQVEKNLDKYPKFEIENHNKQLLRLYRKNRSEAEINKVKREFYKYLAKKYGYFKIGGIIKASDGTKTSWVSNSLGKVGNFLNSDWGKLAFNGISSIFGGNSEPSYNVQNNYSDTMTDTAIQYILQQQQQAQALSDLDSTLKSQYDPQNPHSIDGDIVGRHYKWMASQQAQQKELQKQQKELIDAQNKQQKTNYITNALTNTLQTGLDLALNYKPTTKKGSSVS